MDNRRRTRQRIQSRRGYGGSSNSQNRFVRTLYSFVMLFLIMASLILANLIYQNRGFDTLVMNVKKVVQPLQLYKISDWIPFENWFKKKDTITTSMITHYTFLENQYYQCSNNQVVAVDSGIVVFTQKQDSGYMMIIKQDNNILATYGAMSESHVKVDDRVLKGQILGLSNKEVYLDFTLQGVAMNFEDVITYEN